MAVCAIAPVCQAARICKIKAHQDLCAIPEPLAKYHAIGNAMADTAANAARATGFLDTAELISDLQASAALARAKTRMTMQFCAQATLAFLRHSKDKEDSQRLNAQLVAAWACASHPLRHKPCCGSVTLRTDNLTSLCFRAVKLSLPFGGFLISLCSEIGLLRFNTWFELYLDFRISTQRNVPWNQGGTCDAPRYAMDPQPGYEIVPRPPLQQTLRNFASSVSHLATHLGARVLPTFCVEVKRCNLLTRAFAFEAAVGLSCRSFLQASAGVPVNFSNHSFSLCAWQCFGPGGDISLSVLTLLFLLSHLVSRFLRSLWMYSFRLLENVPLRLVNAVGLGLRDLSLGALVLFRPLRLCASCTSHRGPIVPKPVARP